MIREDCIFCKLANGVIPTNTVYEDDDFRVIMDVSPASKGHCLVVTKQHFDNALTADSDILSKAMVVAAGIGKAAVKVLKCDGVNILQNNGVAAGQTVFHLHLHVIPRWEEDGLNINWNPSQADSQELADTAKLIGEACEL